MANIWDAIFGSALSPNFVLASPNGASGPLTSRALVAADIPNIAESQVTGLTADLALKAPLASPALSGTPTAPTAAGGTNTTQIASTAFVTSAVAAGGVVSSVFGRTGAVVATSGDYSYSQISSTPQLATTKAAVTSNFLTSYTASTGVFTAAQPAESDLTFTDITTNNVSTSKHGFTPKLSGTASQYLDGTGAYSVPAGAVSSVFTRTGAVVAVSGDYTLDQIGNPVASKTFTFAAGNALTIAGTVPATANPGTAADTVITITGAAGGPATSGNNAGGTGGGLAFTSGAGGASQGNAANSNGGDFTFTTGAAGTGGAGAAGRTGFFRVTGAGGLVIGGIPTASAINGGQTDLYVNRGSAVGKIFLGAGGGSANNCAFSTDANGALTVASNSSTYVSWAFSGGCTLTKTFVSYNGIATISNGVPSELATVDLTAQSAAKTATTLYAVPASGVGMYRITWVATITTAASTSSILGGANGFQVLFTSPTDSVVKTEPRTITSGVNTDATNTTATAIGGCVIAYAKASTNIQYQFDYTSVGVTAMVYELHVKIEAM